MSGGRDRRSTSPTSTTPHARLHNDEPPPHLFRSQGDNVMSSQTYRLVPHSGIQFVTFGLDLDAAPLFSRKFVGQKLADRVVDEDTVAMKLLLTSKEDESADEP